MSKTQPTEADLAEYDLFLKQKRPTFIRDCGSYVTYRDLDGHIVTIGKSCPWFAETVAGLHKPKPVRHGYNKARSRRQPMG